MERSDAEHANTVWHHAVIHRPDRERLNGHRSVALWFTGLSGAGKSTLVHAVEERLHQMGCLTSVFDGDNVRHGLYSDLGFSQADRTENIRRIGEMVKRFLGAGVIALTAFISPIRTINHACGNCSGGTTSLRTSANARSKYANSGMSKGITSERREGRSRNLRESPPRMRSRIIRRLL